jgi:hypothetical protein
MMAVQWRENALMIGDGGRITALGRKVRGGVGIARS